MSGFRSSTGRERWALSPRRFGERMISLEAIMQKRASKESAAAGVVPVVLMTHGTTEASIRDALALTLQDGVVREKPQVIRIERDGA